MKVYFSEVVAFGILFREGTMSGERESRRVLVVDHNDSFRAVLVRALAERGCEVDEAPDCETGISKAERSHFDLVFVDCFMPRCGGDEATRIIVARDPGTKVIIISRKPTSDRVERAIEFGARRVLPKPLDARELTEYLDSIL